MFISLFAIEKDSKNKVFRSYLQNHSLPIHSYFLEFLKKSNGAFSEDSFNFFYITNSKFYFVAQTDKFHSQNDAFKTLEFLRNQAGDGDLFDILFAIDNILYFGNSFTDRNLQQILSLESQDEIIYNMMIENKKRSMSKCIDNTRVDTHSMDSMNTHSINSNASMNTHSMNKHSMNKHILNHPFIINLSEKAKIKIDKENYILENSISGEMNMIVTDCAYKHIEIKMIDLDSKNYKYSPYLDKSCIKKGIFKFIKERQLNKSIPLLKWNSKFKDIPISMDYWVDDSEDHYFYTITFTAVKNIKNILINFLVKDLKVLNNSILSNNNSNNHSNNNLILSNNHLNNNSILSNNNFIQIQNLEKSKSITFELKFYGLDSNGIFPIKLNFESDLENSIDIHSVINENEEIEKYEFRKKMEIEMIIESG